METPEITVERFRQRHGLAFVIIARLDGIELRRAGDPSALAHTGLAKSLSGDEQSIARVGAALEGQLLPQVWAQGEDIAYATIFNGTVVIMFERASRDPVALYARSKELEKAMLTELGAV